MHTRDNPILCLDTNLSKGKALLLLLSHFIVLVVSATISVTHSKMGVKRSFMFWVLCCGDRYDFRIKTMFGSSLPPVVCRRARVLFIYLYLLPYSDVQHILCCVFVLFFFVLCWVSFSFWCYLVSRILFSRCRVINNFPII